MKDLKEISGLDIKFEDIGLVYDQEVFPVEPKVRLYSEAKEVYKDQSEEDQDLYYMYRFFEKATDNTLFSSYDFEYDITVINPGTVGDEYVKTAGHYHGNVPGTEITYPEIYEVIEGSIDYLLQTRPDAENGVEVVIVEAEKGDKVVVPPGYGHISVNVGESPAISSNIQKRDLPATADYDTYKKNHGGALYRIDGGWENNNSYKVKSIKRVKPKDLSGWGLLKNKSLYNSVTSAPETFKYLTVPQDADWSDVWEVIEKL
jgi:glucose-6-phosphate isomerase